MLQLLEGSNVIARAVKMCNPAVISAYPITPQTHIVEDLAKFKADGEADYEYVQADSEFAAASIVLGAAVAGVRSYTATSSQGLLLMAEVLFNIAGMRMPVVLTCVNRAVSAPINIWNDQQDAVTARDSGWLMLFAENNQEAAEMHIQAFRIAEETRLPVMVNMDGFVLSHTYEPVELPPENLVKKFLGEYKPPKGEYLDVRHPVSLGCFVTPEHYQKIRQELFEDVRKSKEVIKRVYDDYGKVVVRECKEMTRNGREWEGMEGTSRNGLVEIYNINDADVILVAMGSVVGTLKDSVDELRKKNVKAGVLKIKSFRPFPDDEVVKVVSNGGISNKIKYIAVVDKSISCGGEGVLASEIKRACYGKTNVHIQSFVTGLGGRDITKEMIFKIVSEVQKRKNEVVFV